MVGTRTLADTGAVLAAIDGRNDIAVDAERVTCGIDVDVFEVKRTRIDLDCADGLVGIDDRAVLDREVRIRSEDAAGERISIEINRDRESRRNHYLFIILNRIGKELDGVSIFRIGQCFSQ